MALLSTKPEFDRHLLDADQSKHFSLIIYSDHEIQKAIQYLYLYLHTHPICKPAIELLSATNDFLCATTQEKEFVTLRLENKTLDDLKQVLEDIHDELKAAILCLKSRVQGSKDKAFLESVIKYCKTSIKLQLEKMRRKEDVIYVQFFDSSNLKKIL